MKKANYWAAEVAKEIIKERGKNLTIATGITPSGHIHIGNMREVLTADLVRRELEKLGAKVRFIYITDDFDRLRKLYPFLPKNFEKYIGWPLSKIPDPKGDRSKTYAQRFLEPFLKVLDNLGISYEKISATNMYARGFFTDKIKAVLKNKTKIKKILKDISGRKMPDDWFPFNPLCAKCGKIDEAKIIKEDLENNKVKYKCSCGKTGWADFSKGEGKLAWRVDWPARWSAIPVDVEPYGKEHATVGGSFDTGKAICEQIFKHKAPFGIPYDLLYLKGSQGKMSSSLGNVISAGELLEVVPPEILRYMFARINYSRELKFDPGMGLLQLIDEYTRLEQRYKEKNATSVENAIYEACQIRREGKSISAVPFRHLINTVQAAQGNIDEIKRILKNTGHQQALENNKLLTEQINRVKNWLEKYAPENIKFTVQEQIPKIQLSDKQKELLSILAKDLKNKGWQAENLHNHIYELGKQLGLKPKQTFEPIYLSILGKTSGPKAGWFINILDRDFIIDRFDSIAKH